MTISIQDIIQAILSSLGPELLEPKYRVQLDENSPPETGHCAVATEAFYWLAGGTDAGFLPVACGYNIDADGQMQFGLRNPELQRESHWWVRGPAQGQRGKGALIDITAGQFAVPFPYEQGRGCGFQQPQGIASKRAQIVMDRVAEKLGHAAVESFRQENIVRYNKQRQFAASLKNTL